MERSKKVDGKYLTENILMGNILMGNILTIEWKRGALWI